MSDDIDRLVDSLPDEQVLDLLRRGPARIKPRRYRSIFPQTTLGRESLGEEFIRKVEEEGDEEGVYKKFLRKGTRQPGTSKERVEAYLRRFLEKAEEEGRL